MQAAKVIYSPFKLTTQAGRIGLLCGITAGTVTREEVEAAVIEDTKKRPYRKPVIVDYTRYESISDAARALCRPRASYEDLRATQAWIRNVCNKGVSRRMRWAEQ